MKKKIHETIIIGAGISGLACARKLHEHGKDFLVISKDIGGRAGKYSDKNVSYGAYFIFDNYYNIKKYAKKIRRMRLLDCCFHSKDRNVTILILFRYPLQFIRLLYLIFKFKRKYFNLKKNCETVPQKKVFNADPFIKRIYNQSTEQFIQENKIQDIARNTICPGLRAIVFLPMKKISAIYFLWLAQIFVTKFYEFVLLFDKLTEGFEKKIIRDAVCNITKKAGFYSIKINKNELYAKNVVVATPPHVSKKLLHLKSIKKPAMAFFYHVSGRIKTPYQKGSYHFFEEYHVLLGITKAVDENYIVFTTRKEINLKDYFHDYNIIRHWCWNPAFSIGSGPLWACEQDKNLYLIGDHNACNLEDAFITGIYAANRILGKAK